MKLLNLGCGEPWSHAPAPWVNVDVRPEAEPDLLADITALPCAETSIERIYAGHVLEHLAYLDVLPALKHWFTLLVPGGDMLLVGPDADKTRRLVAAGVITAERAASNDGASDDPNPATHSWFTSARQVLPLAWEAGFDARELALEDLGRMMVMKGFPVYDPATPDQYAILCEKSA